MYFIFFVGKHRKKWEIQYENKTKSKLVSVGLCLCCLLQCSFLNQKQKMPRLNLAIYIYIYNPYHTLFRAPPMSIYLQLSLGIITINFPHNWTSGLQHFHICTQIFQFVNRGSSLHSDESAQTIHIYMLVMLQCLYITCKGTLKANDCKSN